VLGLISLYWSFFYALDLPLKILYKKWENEYIQMLEFKSGIVIDQIKDQQQSDKAERDESASENERLNEIMIKKAVQAYKGGERNMIKFFADKGFPPRMAKKYANMAVERAIRDKAIEEEEEMEKE
jgi:hypothetical protein